MYTKKYGCSEVTRGKRDPSPTQSPKEPVGVQDGCQSCHGSLANVNTKLDKILATLETMGARLSTLEVNLRDMDHRVSANIKDINDLKTSLEMLEKQHMNHLAATNSRFYGHHSDTHKLGNQLDDLQNRNRRNNIVIHGVPEGSEKDQKSCEEFVAGFLAFHMKLEGSEEVEIERAHRTPGNHQSRSGSGTQTRPRLIHVKLLRYTDRKFILKNAARTLKNNPYKGANIYITDDVTSRIRAGRKCLREDHLQSIRNDSRVQFAYIPMSVPAVISYKLKSGPFKTFRLGEATPIS